MYANVFSSFGGFAPSAATASSIFGTKPSEISYDTSSRDPSALRARVFVGNLNTNRVTRDDVIQMFKAYGTLAGVTLFKGYAFVQYSHSSEADLAVSALNGYNWNASVLDVKLAANGMKPSTTLGTSLSTKRTNDSNIAAKRLKTEKSSVDVNVENKAYVKSLSTEINGIVNHDECTNTDTLICGECRFITSSINEFINHRKEPCSFFKSVFIAEDEPSKLQCFTCTEEFVESWSLVQHLTSTHKLSLYRESSFTSKNNDLSPSNGNSQNFTNDLKLKESEMITSDGDTAVKFSQSDRGLEVEEEGENIGD